MNLDLSGFGGLTRFIQAMDQRESVKQALGREGENQKGLFFGEGYKLPTCLRKVKVALARWYLTKK